jgi:hypothetical protein
MSLRIGEIPKECCLVHEVRIDGDRPQGSTCLSRLGGECDHLGAAPTDR